MKKNTTYAGFWVRNAALTIDLFIFHIFVTLTLMIAFAYSDISLDTLTLENGKDQQSFAFYDVVSHLSGNFMLGIWTLFIVLYWPLMTASHKCATFGKEFLMLRVVDQNHKQLTIFKAYCRWSVAAICFLSVIGAIISVFTIVLSKEKRALHDMICSTYVIYDLA